VTIGVARRDRTADRKSFIGASIDEQGANASYNIRDKYIEAGCFRGFQEFDVVQPVPSTSPRLFDGVIGQRRGNTSRGPIVEENAHQRRAAGACRLRAAKWTDLLQAPAYGISVGSSSAVKRPLE
jgi:hypothetical protein